MNDGTQATRRIDRKFVGWHILYTVVLAGWAAMFLVGPVDDCVGREPGYWALWSGVLPSLVMLALGLVRPHAAYMAAVMYGLLVALPPVFFTLTLRSNMWLIVFFPLFPFVAEAAVITLCLRRRASRNRQPITDN